MKIRRCDSYRCGGFYLLAMLLILGGHPRLAGAAEKPSAQNIKGELTIEGENIRRLQFHGKHQVFLENPGATVQVPVAKYHMLQITVGKTNSAARFVSYLYQQTDVTTHKSATLRAGGPLTNILTVNKFGRSLHLDYQLLGAQGHTYRPEDLSQPPRFQVSRNGKQVHAGSFEYG